MEKIITSSVKEEGGCGCSCKEKTCTWVKVEMPDGNYYRSECDVTFDLVYPTPQENKMKYCPSCRKTIIIG